MWTAEYGRIFVALYVHEGSIWLTLGDLQIDTTRSPVGITHHFEGLWGELTVSYDNTVYRFSYLNRGWLWSRIDPSYDDLDRERGDFMFFVARHLHDRKWRSAVLAQWSNGSAHARVGAG